MKLRDLEQVYLNKMETHKNDNKINKSFSV